MIRKIAFEEHMAIPETIEQTRAFAADSVRVDSFTRQILDVDAERLEGMDRNGVDYAVLSLNAPGIQGILDTAEAIRVARKANETVAAATAKHPRRLGGFAALPMQDPAAAAAELTHCVKALGFKGGLVNGFTQKDTPDSALYYDLPEYREFWATVAELDVPIYIHPRMQIPARAQNYQGHTWMMSSPWGFAVETSIHALRLCGSDLFERYPSLRVVIGHLGENIPYGLERMNERMQFSRRGYRGKKLPGEYFAENFRITTSGNFSDPAFRCAVEVMGVDKVSFSADYPYETMEDGCGWFDRTEVVAGADKTRVARGNAIELLKLQPLFPDG